MEEAVVGRDGRSILLLPFASPFFIDEDKSDVSQFVRVFILVLSESDKAACAFVQ